MTEAQGQISGFLSGGTSAGLEAATKELLATGSYPAADRALAWTASAVSLSRSAPQSSQALDCANCAVSEARQAAHRDPLYRSLLVRTLCRQADVLRAAGFVRAALKALTEAGQWASDSHAKWDAQDHFMSLGWIALVRGRVLLTDLPHEAAGYFGFIRQYTNPSSYLRQQLLVHAAFCMYLDSGDTSAMLAELSRARPKLPQVSAQKVIKLLEERPTRCHPASSAKVQGPLLKQLLRAV